MTREISVSLTQLTTTATPQRRIIARGDPCVKVQSFWRQRWALIDEVPPHAASKVC